MSVTRWTLYDPKTDTTLTLEMNPKQVVGLDGVSKAFGYIQPNAEDGIPIFYGKGRRPNEITATGSVISLAGLDQMIEWADKTTQLKLTTDLGRQYWVYFDTFTPTRTNVVNRQYKASFDLHGYTVRRIPAEP